MAKEQIAVAELVLNMILGKTGGTRVDYFPQKPDFPFDAVYEQAFLRATPESQESPLICCCPSSGTGCFQRYGNASFYGTASWQGNL